tara:strand:+ start:315 stop:2933 length:2619 start_codon:yes stop_codon:yes gene_type:complete
MTITAQVPRSGPFSGNGSTVAFTYGFLIDVDAELVVVVRNTSTNVITQKALITDYSVTGAGTVSGGTVTFVTAPTSSEEVAFLRAVPLVQDLDLQNRGVVSPELLEDQLDELTRITQDHAEQLSRAVLADLFGIISIDDLVLNLLSIDANVAAAAASAAAADVSADAARASALEAALVANSAATLLRNVTLVSGGQLAFTLDHDLPLGLVFIDGVQQSVDAYSYTFPTLTFTETVVAGSLVDALFSAGTAAYSLQTFETVTNLLADTVLDYDNTVVGTSIVTRKDSFAYEVAASGATDQDVTTAGGVKLYALADASGTVTAKQFGATSGASSASNTAKIKAAADNFNRVFVEAEIGFDRDSAINLGVGADQIIVTEIDGATSYRATTIEPGTGNSHATVRSILDDNQTGLWVMPRGFPDVGVPSQLQTAAVKIFMEDYVSLGGGDYRDGGFTAENRDSYHGTGTIRINTKAEGNQVPFKPDLHLTFQGGQEIPQRMIQTQERPCPAGNFFAGGIIRFEEGFPIWRTGITVAQGQLVNMYGRIYEAQSAGVTGASAPIHATYEITSLTVADSSAFIIDEIVRNGGPGAPFDYPTGKVYDKPNATTVRVYNENSFALADDWDTTGSVPLTGDTSGGSTAISAQVGVSINVDEASTTYTPIGPPVGGRTVSDGTISWRFLDDLKSFTPGNVGMYPIIMWGDKDSTPILYDNVMRFQLADYSLGIHDTSSLSFPKTGAPTDKFKIYRDAAGSFNLTIEYPGGAKVLFNPVNNAINVEGVAWGRTVLVKTSGDTTVDVTGSEVVTMNDLVATNFTGFTGGVTGQLVTVRFNSANTTLINGTNFEIRSGFNTTGNLTPVAKTAHTFVKTTGSRWTMTS